VCENIGQKRLDIIGYESSRLELEEIAKSRAPELRTDMSQEASTMSNIPTFVSLCTASKSAGE
jgi:hypothetical protein